MTTAWRGESEEPGAESLTVHTSGDGWRGDAQGGDYIPGMASTWTRSAALSLSAVSLHDVRPHLLALMRWEWAGAIEPCLTYGRNYLRAWCSREGQRPRSAVIEAVVVDALALVFWGRCRRGMPTIEDRRAELRVDKGRFAEYRALMVKVFKRRLSESATRYKTISHYQPVPRNDYLANGFAVSSLWVKKHGYPRPVLTLIPAIQHPQSGIMKDGQDFTAMIAPVSRSRAA
jgi:hypothetical protein